MLQLPVSYGEAFDKLTILEIKLENIEDEDKLTNINNEHTNICIVLEPVWDEYGPATKTGARLKLLVGDLKTTNEKLWHIEDTLRELERRKAFEEKFVETARAVYFINDHRSRVKKEINILLGSEIIEEKSYEQY